MKIYFSTHKNTVQLEKGGINLQKKKKEREIKEMKINRKHSIKINKILDHCYSRLENYCYLLHEKYFPI